MLGLGGMVPALADMDWGWSHHSWWGGGLMMLLWVLLVVAVVVVLVRAFDRRPTSGRAGADAEQILAARFARGEIDETEYRGRLRRAEGASLKPPAGAAGSPRPAAPPFRVEVVTSAGCHYCGHALEVLERVGAEVPLHVAEVALESAAGQAALARWRVPFPPIVLVDGELFGYGRISERKLRAALTARGA